MGGAGTRGRLMTVELDLLVRMKAARKAEHRVEAVIRLIAHRMRHVGRTLQISGRYPDFLESRVPGQDRNMIRILEVWRACA
jgi:hypothetical protein